MKHFVWTCFCSEVSILGVGLADQDEARPRHLVVVQQRADVIPIGDDGFSATVVPPDRRCALRGSESDQSLEHEALGGKEAGELDGVVALLIGNSIVPIQFAG